MSNATAEPRGLKREDVVPEDGSFLTLFKTLDEFDEQEAEWLVPDRIMNEFVKDKFKNITAAASGLNSEIARICANFRDAKTRAAVLKDEEAAIANARHIAVKATRVAQADFRALANSEITAIKADVSRALLLRPNTVLVEEVRLYTDFGLKPTRTEVEALRDLNGANFLGCRLINAMLEKNDADWRLNTSDVADFEKDMKDLDAWANADALTVPADFRGELVEIMTGEPHLQRIADGSLMALGFRWDAADVTICSEGFRAMVSNLDKMSERWSANRLNRLTKALSRLRGVDLRGLGAVMAEQRKAESMASKQTPGRTSRAGNQSDGGGSDSSIQWTWSLSEAWTWACARFDEIWPPKSREAFAAAALAKIEEIGKQIGAALWKGITSKVDEIKESSAFKIISAINDALNPAAQAKNLWEAVYNTAKLCGQWISMKLGDGVEEGKPVLEAKTTSGFLDAITSASFKADSVAVTAGTNAMTSAANGVISGKPKVQTAMDGSLVQPADSAVVAFLKKIGIIQSAYAEEAGGWISTADQVREGINREQKEDGKEHGEARPYNWSASPDRKRAVERSVNIWRQMQVSDISFHKRNEGGKTQTAAL